MKDAPISLVDIVAAATVVSVVFGIIVQLLKFGMDFLTAKFSPVTKAERLAQAQSDQCRFDHASIGGLVATQNANIAKMLEQNGKQIEAMKDANHAAELRHQVVLARLEAIATHASNIQSQVSRIEVEAASNHRR